MLYCDLSTNSLMGLHTACDASKLQPLIATEVGREATAAAVLSEEAKALADNMLRDDIYDAMGFIKIQADIAQLYLQTNDDTGLAYALNKLFANTRHAIRNFNSLAERSILKQKEII